ncbi:MAG: hypothetical protein V4510_08675 [bacterium]
MNASRLAATATMFLFVLPGAVADGPETIQDTIVGIVSTAVNALNQTACTPPASPPGDVCGLTGDAAATWNCLVGVVTQWRARLPDPPSDPAGDVQTCIPLSGVLCIQFRAGGPPVPGPTGAYPFGVTSGGAKEGYPFLIHLPTRGPRDQDPIIAGIPSVGEYVISTTQDLGGTRC